MNEFPLLVYDSECTLCERFKKALAVIDMKKHFHYESIHNENVYVKYPILTKEACSQNIHLLLSDKNVLVGPEVVEYILKLIPGAKSFSWLIEKNSSQKAMELFYDKMKSMRQNSHNCRKCGK